MLDVHPPEHTPHSWRDFFIHIATIVLGLLIAIGLEQAVEAIHHRSEVSETRKALRAEFEDNLLHFRFNIASSHLVRQEMSDNLVILLYLKRHPGTPEEQLPGTLHWGERTAFFVNSAWTTAQQNSVIALMPRDEVAGLALTYSQLREAGNMEEQLWSAVNAAKRFSYADVDPSHLSPAQLDKEIDLTEECMDADFRWFVGLENLAQEDRRFTPVPTSADRQQFLGSPRSTAELQKLATAQKFTDDQEKPYLDAQDAAAEAIDARAKMAK